MPSWQQHQDMWPQGAWNKQSWLVDQGYGYEVWPQKPTRDQLLLPQKPIQDQLLWPQKPKQDNLPQRGKGQGKGKRNRMTQDKILYQQRMWLQQQLLLLQQQQAKDNAQYKDNSFQLQIKKEPRFDLNDRVVCNLGMRWIGGRIVGTHPEETDDWCYLVKTDPHPGIESRTITVPEDIDEVCIQEVCFSPTEMHLIKGAAKEISEGVALRFEVGERVSCRVRCKSDALENWQSGEVVSLNVELPLPLEWGDDEFDDEMKGVYPTSIPYLVKLDSGGSVLCHADNYTLIRREGFEPQTRVKGVSKRMEDRREAPGALVRFDHVTERRKVLEVPASEEKKIGSVIQFTDEQKKALFIE
jgi:hypothetical protein